MKEKTINIDMMYGNNEEEESVEAQQQQNTSFSNNDDDVVIILEKVCLNVSCNSRMSASIYPCFNCGLSSFMHL